VNYRIAHSTTYHYSQAVGLCQNEARLRPREFWRQHCLHSDFQVTPAATDFFERSDYFGNQVAYFAVQKMHTQLVVTVTSEVAVYPRPEPGNDLHPIAWEEVRDRLRDGYGHPPQSAKALLEARYYTLDSPMVATSPALAEYASPSFQPERPLLEVVKELMQRIYRDFTYDPCFTSIATPLSEVMAHRRGVCQDFAHLAIACLRVYGLAARYVSGYVETMPQPGAPRLVGADASHAWFSVYIPGTGWVDFDPTNNKLPFDQHITLAWGRDFSDVTPLKGIAFGGGQHSLSVSVDVMRLE